MTTLLDMPTAPPVPAVDTRPARTDAAVRRIAGAAVGGGLALVTYWWVAGGGLGDLDELGERAHVARPADRAGRLGPAAGAGAADGAHPRASSAPSGRTGWRVWHRLVGFTSFTLMLAHIGLITWGYAAGDLAAVPGDVLGPDDDLPRHAARRSPARCAW